MECPDCKAKTFGCSNCGASVPISKLVDIFHYGQCPVCKSHQDEPCPDHISKSKMDEFTKIRITEWIAWVILGIALGVLIYLAGAE